VTFQISARDERELIARSLHKRAVIRVDHFAAGCWKSPLRTRTACPRLMEPLGRVLFISWLERLNRYKKCSIQGEYEIQIGCSWAGFFAVVRLVSLLLS
jgi:hypothetical protein